MTIVSRSRSFIFVHLHKCGGTSVEQAFAPYAGWRDLIVGSTRWGELMQPLYKWRYGLTKHSSAGSIMRAVGPELWSRSWKIALVRHPMRVYESFYGWISEMAESYKAQHGLDREQFARLCERDNPPLWFMQWHATKAYAASQSFAEFVDVLLTRNWMAQTMTRRLSQSGTLIVDDVFKLEEIDRFWPAFAARTSVRLEPLHANRSRPQHYQWDERHVAMMHERFRDDFINFKYE